MSQRTGLFLRLASLIGTGIGLLLSGFATLWQGNADKELVAITIGFTFMVLSLLPFSMALPLVSRVRVKK